MTIKLDKYYYITDYEKYITIEELKADFEESKKEDPINYDMTFQEYIAFCNVLNNGSIQTLQQRKYDLLRYLNTFDPWDEEIPYIQAEIESIESMY